MGCIQVMWCSDQTLSSSSPAPSSGLPGTARRGHTEALATLACCGSWTKLTLCSSWCPPGGLSAPGQHQSPYRHLRFHFPINSAPHPLSMDPRLCGPSINHRQNDSFSSPFRTLSQFTVIICLHFCLCQPRGQRMTRRQSSVTAARTPWAQSRDEFCPRSGKMEMVCETCDQRRHSSREQ